MTAVARGAGRVQEAIRVQLRVLAANDPAVKEDFRTLTRLLSRGTLAQIWGCAAGCGAPARSPLASPDAPSTNHALRVASL